MFFCIVPPSFHVITGYLTVALPASMLPENSSDLEHYASESYRSMKHIVEAQVELTFSNFKITLDRLQTSWCFNTNFNSLKL